MGDVSPQQQHDADDDADGTGSLTEPHDAEGDRPGRDISRRPWVLTALLLLAFAGFIALGIWQVQRMHWKHDLIARVDARVHAEPVAFPDASALASAKGDTLEYRRVRLSGDYAASATALVRAATTLGTGYWVMTPMRLADGRPVWINRGFVPEGTKLDAVIARTPETAKVIGLLRLDEPEGSLLQSNLPEEDRWYSRDIAALSRSRGIGPAAQIFVDAQKESSGRTDPGDPNPVPGLTVINFPDNHLSYALTWFALAALSLVGIGFAWRRTSGTEG